ncbi:MAG: asparagine synthase (glutamine-hydrolyzing) [Phycisphaerales bacterium]
MCGILAIATAVGERPGLSLATVGAMRDRMAHRGPDGTGLLDLGHVILAHRRLAVVDLSPAGAQPMTTTDGRFSLVYNGELYNNAELRAELARVGTRLCSTSDAETVLHALACWGTGALPRLRGMFALALFDRVADTLLLARDPLGIKPLLWWKRTRPDGIAEIVAASEPGAILAHPEFRAKPDVATMSAYLTTIRVTLGERTLFEGIRTLEPGTSLNFDLRAAGLPAERGKIAWPEPAPIDPTKANAAREAVEDSVHRHLHADVPVGCLLSGGLDSTIITALARRELAGLRTFASGARGGNENDDLAHADAAARELCTRHLEAPVSRGGFAESWRWLVREQGVPLGTPNEVAILHVARAVRSAGIVVALSGEGADELFCGYDAPLLSAARFERNEGAADAMARTPSGRGLFHLRDAAWMPLELKPTLLSPGLTRAIEGDAALIDDYERAFALQWRADDMLGSHQRFLRRVNLAGLLLRLDSCTMRASVEGRTPLADVAVAALAESMSMEARIDLKGTPPETKIPLRRGFADVVPAAVLARPKASFPLPFAAWLEDQAGVLGASRFAREVFSAEAIAAIDANPSAHWRFAWPMLNLAIWGERFWGG